MSIVATPDARVALLKATRRVVRRGRAQYRWTRFSFVAGVTIVGLILFSSLFQPFLGLPSPTHQDFNAVLLSPRSGHLFGTDALGRDLFARTLAASRLDVGVAASLSGIGMLIGIPMGAVAGYFGGWVDHVVMRLSDFALAIPQLVFILAVVAMLGSGLVAVYVGICYVNWALYARLTRAEMLVVREREYIGAARTLGFPTKRVLFRHALPNVLRPALVYCPADMVLNVALLASLSFLGLGVQPPTPEWGSIIADGQDYLLSAWWISTLPGMVLALYGVGLSLIGDSGADLLGHELRFDI